MWVGAASSTVVPVNLATAGHGVRARLRPWPREPDIGHLVLVDHEMVPSNDDVARWVADARSRGLRALRTGALFPASTEAFLATGFDTIDRLVLLRLDLSRHPGPVTTGRGLARHRTTRRLGSSRLGEAAEVDRRAFGGRWSNDAASLSDIRHATPHQRSRMIAAGGSVAGFAISGRAGRRAYIQRLAVAPAEQRNGHGRALVDDALAWMRRRRASTALVNTAVDNIAAVALYESAGFERQDGDLTVLELRLRS